VRRALLAVTGLAAGTTLLISLKSAPGASRLPDDLAADLAAERATGRSATPVAPTSPVPPKTRAPGGGGATTPKPGPAPQVGGPILGTAVLTPYGYVRVSIKVSGNRLTDVTAVQLPDSEARSERLSARAGPILRQSALAAQSADIDTVSGATFTSEAYAESLQSALDKAKLG